jgi:hypothetical protein
LAAVAAGLAASALAQRSAALSFVSAGPAVVAPRGRMDVTVRITNTSSVAWEPLATPTDCDFLISYLVSMSQACPTYPSPSVPSNWGKKALFLFVYPMGLGRPWADTDLWWGQIELPGVVQPGATVVVSGHFAAPMPPGDYVVGPVITEFGCCNFTDRVLHSAQDGYDRSPHFPFRVAADTTPPSLILSGLLAGACEIWPPNNKMVEAGSLRAVDSQNAIANFSVNVTSNDPGTAPGDIEVATGADGAKLVRLRASRSGAFGDRIYTIAAVAADTAGNTQTQTLTCRVKHDQGK